MRNFLLKTMTMLVIVGAIACHKDVAITEEPISTSLDGMTQKADSTATDSSVTLRGNSNCNLFINVTSGFSSATACGSSITGTARGNATFSVKAPDAGNDWCPSTIRVSLQKQNGSSWSDIGSAVIANGSTFNIPYTITSTGTYRVFATATFTGTWSGLCKTCSGTTNSTYPIYMTVYNNNVPQPSPALTVSKSYFSTGWLFWTNSYVKFSLTPTTTVSCSHQWSIHGPSNTPSTSDNLPTVAVGWGTTYSFDIPKNGKYYWIKHGVWTNCVSWRESRTIVQAN